MGKGFFVDKDDRISIDISCDRIEVEIEKIYQSHTLYQREDDRMGRVRIRRRTMNRGSKPERVVDGLPRIRKEENE